MSSDSQPIQRYQKDIRGMSANCQQICGLHDRCIGYEPENSGWCGILFAPPVTDFVWPDGTAGAARAGSGADIAGSSESGYYTCWKKECVLPAAGNDTSSALTWMLKESGQCSDTPACRALLSQTECETAAAEMTGMLVAGHTGGAWSHRVSGCFRDNGDVLAWNTDINSRACGHGSRPCVCACTTGSSSDGG